ncbi:MAG TPA: glycosyltransferase family 4 protein [Candidatus Paceibacterota bacterium]|nr:glycosyltransferase family 4 protein [Candidatus Paceibacterota bacterium]
MKSGKPKILICTGIFPPEIGGPASYALSLAGHLAGQGQVTVLTYSRSWSWAEDAKLSFRVVRIWLGWPKVLRHLIYLFRASWLARGCDTVLALNAISAGIPARLVVGKARFVVRIVGDAAWEKAINTGATSLLLNDFQSSKRSGLIARMHGWQLKTCERADAIIVPSEYLAGIVAGWGVPREKIHVVYNAVDFKPSPLSKEEARKKLGISGNIILTVGRLVPWKGFQMLIKIIPKLSEINQFFKLVIVGDGPDRNKLGSVIKNLNLERKVVMVGRKSQTDLADYMAAADMAVLNTGYEGFSHLILEFMSAGVPVITTNAGGNLEVIHQGENGLMVKYNDEFNLIEAVRAIWNNSELRDKFIAAGRETVGELTVDNMFEQTLKVILP